METDKLLCNCGSFCMIMLLSIVALMYLSCFGIIVFLFCKCVL